MVAYLDEASQLKRLPSNSRAVAIAGLCGYDNVPLCGDIYLGKLIGRHTSCIFDFIFFVIYSNNNISFLGYKFQQWAVMALLEMARDQFVI